MTKIDVVDAAVDEPSIEIERAHVILGPLRRCVLPLNTGGLRLKPGQTYIIKEKPEQGTFTPERLFIFAANGPLEDWHICDLTIGNRSLYKQCGSLSGALFAQDATPRRARPAGIEGGTLGDRVGVADDFVAFGNHRAFPWQTIKLIVAYQGNDPEGREFVANLLGTGQEIDLIVPGSKA